VDQDGGRAAAAAAMAHGRVLCQVQSWWRRAAVLKDPLLVSQTAAATAAGFGDDRADATDQPVAQTYDYQRLTGCNRNTRRQQHPSSYGHFAGQSRHQTATIPTLFAPLFPFGLICFVVLVMRKRGESS